ncbi:ribonuclease H-like protein [Sanghuangporus baumii]|uniref:Ribonuclease H-like protein n=1 Tax=Sanghuangporus baumii TaxID=108892 RepID=A0A9Q5HTM4_SANBA|nr:ribonuclease H-like protein [Sanghuangporus baumii]
MIRLTSTTIRASSAAKFQRHLEPKRSFKRYVSEFVMSTTFAASTAASSEQNQSALAPMSQMRGFDQGPLVWIDLEMTGLNARSDEIMEIAVLITDGNLELLDDGIQYVVKVDKEKLDNMDEWCTRQHGSTGLTQACLDSPHTLPFVEDAALEYIRRYIPEKRAGVLAGNSVHVDRMFLAERMPRLLDHLHYRALDDIRGSIKGELLAFASMNSRDVLRFFYRTPELQWYRDHIFVRPDGIAPNTYSSEQT